MLPPSATTPAFQTRRPGDGAGQGSSAWAMFESMKVVGGEYGRAMSLSVPKCLHLSPRKTDVCQCPIAAKRDHGGFRLMFHLRKLDS